MYRTYREVQNLEKKASPYKPLNFSLSERSNLTPEVQVYKLIHLFSNPIYSFVYFILHKQQLTPCCSRTSLYKALLILLHIHDIQSRKHLISDLLHHKTILYCFPRLTYHNFPKFSDRQVWAKGVDPDESSLIRVYTVCHSICTFWTHYSIVEPPC